MYALPLRRIKPTRQLLRLSSTSGQQEATPSTVVVRQQIQDVAKSTAIEKLSLSRGLSMNKFEKDFLIYPEYADSDDLRNIEGFVEILRESIKQTLDPKLLEREGHLPENLQQALFNNQVTAVTVPGTFEGLGMCLKDSAKIYEELSVDWNIFSTVNLSHTVSQLLIIYGTDDQKQKYLPLLASGKCRPAIAYPTLDRSSKCTAEVSGCTGSTNLIDVKDMPVIGSQNPNLLLVFAHGSHPVTKDRIYTCYIVDHADLKENDTWNIQRNETLGLKALQVGTIDLCTNIDLANVLGEVGSGVDVGSELTCVGRLPMAAAAVGYAKRLLDELATRCNRALSANDPRRSLASNVGAQRVATQLALKLYALESSTYYLAGLLDESIPLVVDVESALIHRLTRELLETCVSTTVELVGMNAGRVDDCFEKNIRDISTILALTREENCVEEVALATLSTWAASNYERITSTIKRLLSNEKIASDLRNPKLQHYIAEHAHPSLQHACQELEFSMSRLNSVISKMVKEQGKNLDQDFGSLESLVNVLQNHLCMVSVISRASRSYAIGLRNSDIELSWATSIATRLSRDNWFQLEAMYDYFGLVRFNPSLLSPGQAIFDLGGYKIESPVEKNW